MKTLISILLAFAMSLNFVGADTRTVDNNPSRAADYDNLQAAIDDAVPGDTIYVMGSATLYGNITLNKTLTVYGPGYFLGANNIPAVEQNPARLNSLTVTDSASGSQISGMAVGGSFSHHNAIINASDIAIGRCYFLQPVDVGTTSLAERVSFEQCVFGESGSGGRLNLGLFSHHPGVNALLVSNSFINIIGTAVETSDATIDQCVIGGGTLKNVTVRNSIFTGSSSLTFDAETTFEHCLAPGDILPEGGDNINGANLSTVFVGWNVGDPPSASTTADTWMQLIPNASINPAIGAGTTGQDLGMFGGEFPYVVSGIPPLPRVTSMVAPIVIAEGDTLSVEVQVEAGE